MTRRSWTLAAALVCSVSAVGTVQAQWSNAALFNEPGDAGMDVKTGAIAAVQGGGFEGVYFRNNNGIRYRRYILSLSAAVDVWTGGQCFNARMCEALNGDIHVVFEDWASGSPNVRWHKSSNAGASFPVTQVLTNVTCAKFPHVVPFGTGTAPDVVMSYFRSGSTGGCNKSLYFERYNGTSWTADANIGSSSNSEYDCFGMARSPVDGSIYRSFDPSGTSMSMRRYNGSWGSEIPLVSGSWAVRQHMAINTSGQVMIAWDSNSHIWTQIYTPGVGATTPQDMGAGGYSGSCDVCAVPGTNDFYLVVGRDLGGTNNFHVYGRRYSAGAWQAEESVMNGLSNYFLVTPIVTADEFGSLYCIWEYWASGKPQQWYAVKPGGLPPGPKGYVSGTVRDNFGALLPNASVTIPGIGTALTSASGAYTLQSLTGTYTVTCSKSFYTSQSATGVVITDGGTTTVNFTLAGTPPAQIATLTVVPGNAANTLSWTCPSSGNFNGTMVRYSLTAYPASPTDGTLAADLAGTPGSAASCTHSGLTNGTTYYYSAFAYFADASRYYAPGRASNIGVPYGPCDHDHDGDVDQEDFGHFQTCLTGPIDVVYDQSCFDADFNGDRHVDRDDLTIFEACFSGPGVLEIPACAG